MTAKFYLVWLPGKGAPTFKHPVVSDAIAESMRLAKKEKQAVFVMECIGAAVPGEPPVVWQGAE